MGWTIFMLFIAILSLAFAIILLFFAWERFKECKKSCAIYLLVAALDFASFITCLNMAFH